MADEEGSLVAKTTDMLFPALIVFAIPYCTGFFYLNAYFSYFGLTISELDLSEKEVFIAAFTAIRDFIKESGFSTIVAPVIVILILLAILYATIRFGLKVNLKPRIRLHISNWPSTTKTIAISILLAVLLISANLADKAGERAAQRASNTFPNIMIFGTPVASSAGASSPLQEKQILNYRQDRLVYANKNTLFILRKTSNEGVPSIIRVPRSDSLFSLTPLTWSRSE